MNADAPARPRTGPGSRRKRRLPTIGAAALSQKGSSAPGWQGSPFFPKLASGRVVVPVFPPRVRQPASRIVSCTTMKPAILSTSVTELIAVLKTKVSWPAAPAGCSRTQRR